jgi:hypothetical protein
MEKSERVSIIEKKKAGRAARLSSRRIAAPEVSFLQITDGKLLDGIVFLVRTGYAQRK